MFLEKHVQFTVIIKMNLIKFYLKCNSFLYSFRGTLEPGSLFSDILNHNQKQMGIATMLPATYMNIGWPAANYISYAMNICICVTQIYLQMAKFVVLHFGFDENFNIYSKFP